MFDFLCLKNLIVLKILLGFLENFDTDMNILVHFSFNGANFILRLILLLFKNVLSQVGIFFFQI